MARLLKLEIYAEINAHLCGLEIQNKHILQKSLTGDSYFKLVYRAKPIEKIELLYDKFGAVGKFFVVNLAAKIVLLLTFVLKTIC